MPISPRMRFLSAAVLALGLAGFLGGCSSTDDKDKDAYQERPVEELYNSAMNSLSRNEYETAAKGFDEVERQHPYSVWATKAQLMAAYAHYQNSKFDEAIMALDRFIQLHPGHRDIAYAYYLKALCYYEQIADVSRDQKITGQALDSLQEVVRRFPGTKYALDASMKIDLTRDHLAGKEMAIGRYYQNQQQYTAAINRYRTVLDDYQTTTHVPEAMHRMIECYEALGLEDAAKKTAAVLGYNYPGNIWYGDSYTLVTGEKADPPYGKKGSSWLGWIGLD